MKTSHEKYRRSHWWKFTDWENVGIGAIVIALCGGMIFGLGWVIAHPGTDDNDKTDSAITAVEEFNKNCDSTLALQNQPDTTKSEEKTKSDDEVFDSTIGGTRVVIKTNRPVRGRHKVNFNNF